MNNIRIWPDNTIPIELINSMINFYKNQKSHDKYFNQRDKRGSPPKMKDLPELYNLLNKLGYTNYNFNLDKNIRGNYLETNSSYPIHADTDKNNFHNLNYTIFLIPLVIPKNCHSYLFLLEQFWLGEATTLTKDNWPKGWNNLETDYNNKYLNNLKFNQWDDRFNYFSIPFSKDTLDGMSINSIYKWNVGSLITFPCTQLHFSITNSLEYKLGLSLRILQET